MTGLIFVLQSDVVHIATDTLALSPDTKQPFLNVTKLFPLPHLVGVMCGTGAMPVILDWFVFVQSQVLARDMSYLNEVAPQILPGIGTRHGLTDRMTATIYHFGHLPREGRFAGFAYRSTNGFRSERLIHGIGIKPDHVDLLQVGAQIIYEKGIPDTFITLMEQMKLRDDNLPAVDRVGIGGEIHSLSMQKDEYLLHVCHRFDQYDRLFDTMLGELKAFNARQASS